MFRTVAVLCLSALAMTAASPSLDPQGARALSTFLAAEVSRGVVPGAVVLVTSPDRILYHEAFGRMDAGHNIAMRKDAIFRIASMTKALTSTAIMMLVEEGKLGLDDDVAKYLPALKNMRVAFNINVAAGKFETRPASRPITIRQLLTHTSGIGYSWSDPGLAMIERATGKSSETELPLLHEPGEQWTYGASTKVLGDVVEKISFLRIDAFLESRIFKPLGMLDTAYSVPAGKRDRLVTLSTKKDGRMTETPNPMVIAVQPRGDGRLFSTATDYARFVRLILNHGQAEGKQLLKQETVADMARNQTGNVKVRLQNVANLDYSRPYPLGAGEDVWGLGFQLAAPANPSPVMRRPGSMSWAGINNTFFWIDPQEQVGVIVLMQMLPFYDEGAIALLQGVEKRIYQNLHRQ